MAEVVSLKTGHPLVGTWRDADDESGTSVRFTIRPAGQNFDVVGVDTSDGEVLSISNVRWDGHALRFDSLVPSAAPDGTRPRSRASLARGAIADAPCRR